MQRSTWQCPSRLQRGKHVPALVEPQRDYPRGATKHEVKLNTPAHGTPPGAWAKNMHRAVSMPTRALT